jgi:hypothetical protein
MQQLIMKSTKDDNIQIHPHCNSPYCSQKIIELNPSIGCEEREGKSLNISIVLRHNPGGYNLRSEKNPGCREDNS